MVTFRRAVFISPLLFAAAVLVLSCLFACLTSEVLE